MQSLLSLLKTYEVWIYALLAIASVMPLIRLVSALAEWRKSTFGLEREAALRRVASSATMLSLIFSIVLAQFILVTFIAPLEPVVPVEEEEGGGFNFLSLLGVTETPTPEPGEVQQDAAALMSSGCVKDVLEWTYPAPAQVVSGLVELRGTVQFDNLGFYKFEYRQAGTQTWTAIAAGDQPRKDDLLGGEWSTRQLINGDYELQIVAVDTENNPFPACIIPITIVNETLN